MRSYENAKLTLAQMIFNKALRRRLLGRKGWDRGSKARWKGGLAAAYSPTQQPVQYHPRW